MCKVVYTIGCKTADVISLVNNDVWFWYCSEGNDTEPYITPAGFQFLLLDTASQIWFFMLQYLETVQARLAFTSFHCVWVKCCLSIACTAVH